MYVFMCLHLSLHTGDVPLDIYIFGNQLTPVSTTTRVERAGKASQEVTLKCGETHTTKHSSVGVLNAFRDSFCEAISIFCANFFFPIVVKYLLPCQLMIFYIFQACLSTTSTERTYKLVAFS